MITGIITFLIIFAVIGSILYGQRLIKTEKTDAVFGNPERAKGGVHWVIVGSSFLLFCWLYYSWDIAKAFYPKSANDLCQVAKVNESLLSLKYLFPIEERSHKSTAYKDFDNTTDNSFIAFVKGVLQIMDNLGGRADCQEMAQEQIVQAKAAIKNLSISEEAHVILDAIAEYFVTRKN